MGHEVIYGLIIKVRVNGDVSCLNTISDFIDSVLSELRLCFQFIGKHKTLLNQNLCYQFIFIEDKSKLLFLLSDIFLEQRKVFFFTLIRIRGKIHTGETGFTQCEYLETKLVYLLLVFWSNQFSFV